MYSYKFYKFSVANYIYLKIHVFDINSLNFLEKVHVYLLELNPRKLPN